MAKKKKTTTGRWGPDTESPSALTRRLKLEGRYGEFKAYQEWFFNLYEVPKLTNHGKTPLQRKSQVDVVARFAPLLKPGYVEELKKAERLRKLDLEYEAELPWMDEAAIEHSARIRQERIDEIEAAQAEMNAGIAKQRQDAVKRRAVQNELQAKSEARGTGSFGDPNSEIEEQLQALAEQGVEMDFDRDWEWAYHNHSLISVMPRDAPSPGAWKVLEYARNQPVKFMEKTLGWAEKRRKDDSASAKFQDEDQRSQFKMIERMEKSIRSSCETVVTGLAKQYPAEVAQVLRKLEWNVKPPKFEVAE